MAWDHEHQWLIRGLHDKHCTVCRISWLDYLGQAAMTHPQPSKDRVLVRRKRLRARVFEKVQQLPLGWQVAPTRLAHHMIGDRAVCGVTWMDDGPPPPGPLVLCRKCKRSYGEVWA